MSPSAQTMGLKEFIPRCQPDHDRHEKGRCFTGSRRIGAFGIKGSGGGAEARLGGGARPGPAAPVRRERGRSGVPRLRCEYHLAGGRKVGEEEDCVLVVPAALEFLPAGDGRPAPGGSRWWQGGALRRRRGRRSGRTSLPARRAGPPGPPRSRGGLRSRPAPSRLDGLWRRSSTGSPWSSRTLDPRGRTSWTRCVRRRR